MSVTTKEIVDYVMESPSNTNPAVLRSLLNQYNEGGENPNYRLVIHGTMTNPFGGFDFVDLARGLTDGTYSAKLSFDGTPIGLSGIVTIPLVNFDPQVLIVAGFSVIITNGSITTSAVVQWSLRYSDVKLMIATMNSGGVDTDLSQYAPTIETTLTIYIHPAPQPYLD